MKHPRHRARIRGLPRNVWAAFIWAILAAALALIGPATASAATFTVNSLADTNDLACDADCTLREAILEANASGVADTIEFSISGTIAPTSDLPALLSLDTIDGSTATGYTVGNPTIEIDGSAGGITLGIALGSNSALNAVVVNGVGSGRGVQLNSNNVVTGCLIGTNLAGTASDANQSGVWVGGPGNTVGGPTIASRNVVSGNSYGVRIDWPSLANIVTGNYIGTNTTGTAPIPNAVGVDMNAASSVGLPSDPPNVISGNSTVGISVDRTASTGSTRLIRNNLIGTNASGSAALPNGGGITLNAGTDTVDIGLPGSGNVISGNTGNGIDLSGNQVSIAANHIGTNAAGTVAIGNAGQGVAVLGGGSNNIGGVPAATFGNEIAFNAQGAVRVDPVAAGGNLIRGNSIHDNSGPAGWPEIDLDNNGVTANDTLDLDSGPNGLVNHPVLTSATISPTTGLVTMTGSLNSLTSWNFFSIDLYASPACDDSGSGGGRAMIGTVDVDTDIAGDATFSAQSTVVPPAGYTTITALSTQSGLNSTSEYSPCVTASSPATVPTPPQPVPGEKIVVEPVSGKVFVKLPGTNQYVPLEAVESIPVGSIVDAREGRVKLTAAAQDGTSSAVFYKGRFKVTQSRADGLLTNLKLVNDTNKCSSSSLASTDRASTAKKKKKKKKKGELWGDGDGNYRTTGDNGSATVRGTNWQTVNRCDGTLFFVKRGKVQVRDFNRKKTITLKQGKKYLAKAK